MKRAIKVGILVSYDYELIKNSLPPIYECADKIVLAVDKNNKTWAGNKIRISDDFWQWINNFDTQQKIEIYKDSFCIENLTSKQNETRERVMLAQYMGEGDWHIQLDADEYFVDFKHFVDFLHYLDKKKKHINCVYVQWLTLFKKTANDFLLVNGRQGESIPLAVTVPQYINCREIKNPHSAFYSKKIIHDSWARTEEALWTKLKNWGHNNDFDTEGYFHYWKVIDETNYMFVRNFHPLGSEYWSNLVKIDAGNINDLLQQVKQNEILLNANWDDKRIINKFIKKIAKKVFNEYF